MLDQNVVLDWPGIVLFQLDLTEYSDERRSGEWVPYVQAARDEKEQNLEAFLQDGRLRYRLELNINILHIS